MIRKLLTKRRTTSAPTPPRQYATYRPGPVLFDQARESARIEGRDPWADDPDRTTRRESVDTFLAEVDLLALPIATGTLVGRQEVA